ncbi:MAG TPA: hypothetical protein VIS06_06855 [Mycobacteriales bacterium]
MTAVLARASRWLVRREPLWLVGGAGMLVDVLTYALPVVPDRWHPYVNAGLVVAGVVAGRSQVTPVRKFATGGTITGTGQLRTAGPETTPAGQGHVRRVNAAGYGGHPDTGGRAEPTTGPQTPSGASGANPLSTRTGLQQVVAMPPVVEPGGTPPVDFDG